MHPIIATFGPFTVYSYGLMLAIAFLVGSSLASAQARKVKQNPDTIFTLCFIAVVFGIIGARVLFILQNFSFFIQNPREMIMLAHGGLSWFGGLIAGSAACIFYLRRQRLPLFSTLDLLAPFIALGQAIGRIGCFFNGCCYGRESVCGLYSQAQDALLIPTQIYSSVFLLLIFVVLRLLQERPHPAGKIFFLYLLLYTGKRFIIEFWRGDAQIAAYGLTLFQIFSLVIFTVALAGLARVARKGT